MPIYHVFAAIGLMDQTQELTIAEALRIARENNPPPALLETNP